jgi:soluble epoxide hydrolase/lipid-phosphate phosphatase
MRKDCTDLTERSVPAGHWVAQERPTEVNDAIGDWLSERGIR